MVTAEQLDWLRRPAGADLLANLRELSPTPATAIAISTRLRKTYPADLVIAALDLTELRMRARAKFSQADDMWFTADGLEQATSETIGRYRAGRFAGIAEIVDLCCGIGGDLLALAAVNPDACLTAVDRDPVHVAMAALNADILGAGNRIAFVVADVRDVQLAAAAGVYIDPARRSDRGRMATGQSEPPLEWCTALAGAGRAVGIKCAPGLDRERTPEGWEFETIALGANLKEGVLWSPSLARSRASATVIDGQEIHRLLPIPGDIVPIRTPAEGETLLDPNPAVTRAGLVEDLARQIGAVKIDERIGFLVASGSITTPFARSLRIVASLPWNERLLRARLRELDAGPLDIRRRGLAGDVDAISRRLRGKGAHPFAIAMTRVMDEPWALICTSP